MIHLCKKALLFGAGQVRWVAKVGCRPLVSVRGVRYGVWREALGRETAVRVSFGGLRQGGKMVLRCEGRQS